MLRKILKDGLASLLYKTGMLAWLVRRRFQGRAIVLTYHRVLPAPLLEKSFSHPAIIVSPDVFELHVAALNRHFTCIGLDEFTDRIQRRDFARGAYCLITFDDAWRDNYDFAFPVLKRARTPAVIFVPTDYVDTGRLFWQERLGHLLAAICNEPSDQARKVLEANGWAHLPALPQPDRVEAIRSASRALKTKDYAQVGRIISELTAALGQSPDGFEPDVYLDLAQMREMAQHGISFQSHACSHRILTRLSDAELEQELDASRRWLQEQLGSSASAIAYPNGDHSARVHDSAGKAGYELGFTTENGCADACENRLALRRVNLNDAAAGSEARLLLTLLMSG